MTTDESDQCVPVERWLLAYLELAQAFGVRGTLRGCMRSGHSAMGLRLIDASSGERGHDDPPARSAYLAALRDLASRGLVRPAAPDEAGRSAWARWLAAERGHEETTDPIMDLSLDDARPFADGTPGGGPPAQRACNLLLEQVHAEGPMRLSQVYDGSARNRAALCALLGIRPGGVGPAIILELALDQLQSAGIVKVTDCDGPLIEEEHDVLIELTDAGRACGPRFALQLPSIFL